MSETSQKPDMKLTPNEIVGVQNVRAGIIQAKAALCDAREALRTVEQRLPDMLVAYAFARGLTAGSVELSADGTELVVR